MCDDIVLECTACLCTEVKGKRGKLKMDLQIMKVWEPSMRGQA